MSGGVILGAVSGAGPVVAIAIPLVVVTAIDLRLREVSYGNKLRNEKETVPVKISLD